MMNEFYLELTTGPDAGTCYNIQGESALIGRAAECGIRLENVRGVSRNHCRVFNDAQGLRMVDLDSQNGVQVNGKKVKEAIGEPGVTFQVGEAIFIVRAAIGGALATTGSTVFAAAPGFDTPPPGELGQVRPDMPLGVPAAPGQTVQVSGDLGSGIDGGKSVLFQLLAFVLFIFGVIYLFDYVSNSPRPNTVFAMVKAYQPKVVNFAVDFDRYKILSSTGSQQEIIRAKDYRGLLLPSLERLKKNPNTAKVRMLEITGAREGEAKVILQDKAGNFLRSFRIICRGVNPYRIPDDITREEARRLAESALAQAQRFAKDKQEYDAWVQYQRAADLYNGPAADAERGGNAAVEAFNLKAKLKDRLCALFDEAMAAAFPPDNNFRSSDLDSAVVLLEEAKTIIPDEESVDRQVIENWIINLKRIKSVRRNRGNHD